MASKSYFYIIDLILLFSWNIVFFVVKGFSNYATTWLCFFFFHFSFLLSILLSLLNSKSNNRFIHTQTPYLLTGIYFIFELIYCSFIIYVHVFDFYKTFIIHILVTALFCICYVVTVFFNKMTDDSIASGNADILFVKDSLLKVKQVLHSPLSPEEHEKIEHLSEIIHASPVCDSSSMKLKEKDILQMLDELGTSDKKIILAEEIEQLFNERNSL